ncbi:P1 [Soybean chlorotic leafroll virus]|uniref:P1 n=1 Tax=Soybean chlorotic leafroll virus TaxID=2959664 RepID=A0AAE9MCC2_9VIRU|nr:P1 [Soybean chlorotic leafroll virus]
MTTLKFVVLSFFCLFCFVVPTTMGSQELGLNFRPVQFGNITSPGWQTNWDSTYRVSMSTTPKSYSEYRTWSLPGENAIPTPTYKGVILDLWGLVSRDVKTLCLAVFENLDNFSRHTADSLMLGLKAMAREVCWIAIYVWYSALRSIIVTIWRTVRHNFTLVLSAALLGVFSMLLVKIVRWIFGQLPVYLVLTFLKTCRWIFRRLFWSKRARNYAEEKCCEQFLTFSISQDPPKRSQLVFQNEDGKHVGYGTCIRLFNGTNGLITAYHVASSAYKVVSTRNGNKIPLSAFKPLMVSPLYDQALYEGPCEWESLLGCKGVNFAPAKSLGACKCSIYKIGDDGKWECTNAEIEGQLKHHVMNEDTGEKRSALPGQLSVLSDTTRGQSGSGYFNGKTLVAIHVGGSLECEDEDASYNVAVPVLPKAGLTAPNYVFETTAPTSGVFDSHTIEKLTAAYDEALKFMKSKKASGKALWCDLEDDEFPYQVEGPQREKNNTPSGNGKRGADRGTTGKTVQHPGSAASAIPANDIPTGEQIMSMLVERIANNINLKEVERASINAIRDQALKKPSRSSRRRYNKRNEGNNGNTRRETTACSSTPSMTGSYTPPHRRSQASGPAVKPPNGFIQNRRQNVDGGKRSSEHIPKWVRKPTGSDGPSSGHKLN